MEYNGFEIFCFIVLFIAIFIAIGKYDYEKEKSDKKK